MEIKVGQRARYKYENSSYIDKIQGITSFGNVMFGTSNPNVSNVINRTNILKTANNPEDLLEVGDIVITTNQVGRVAFLIETETQRYIYSKNKDWFNITDIIPREAIELLKVLYQKQNT